MFYNTENLMDTINDPKTNDDDFTPEGKYHWTSYRYNHKLQNIYKVITAIGEGTVPEIVTFCEVENKKVISDLITQTPLTRYPYKIVHYESPDPRGIDVGLIYQSNKLKVLESKPIYIRFPKYLGEHQTRHILQCKFLYHQTDTFFVFVNHWPSRRSGNTDTEKLRLFTAQQLKNQTDSIFNKNQRAKIIIVGDFNDEPGNNSLTSGLKVHNQLDNVSYHALYNLSVDFLNKYNTGTHKFDGQWLTFDQIIVSGALLLDKNDLHSDTAGARVFNNSFILIPDKKNMGFRPNRTYSGFKYTGGFSDHLPVYLDLLIKK